jgi:hypothetical protein
MHRSVYSVDHVVEPRQGMDSVSKRVGSMSRSSPAVKELLESVYKMVGN